MSAPGPRTMGNIKKKCRGLPSQVDYNSANHGQLSEMSDYNNNKYKEIELSFKSLEFERVTKLKEK